MLQVCKRTVRLLRVGYRTDRRFDVSDVDQLIKEQGTSVITDKTGQLTRNSVSSNINNRPEAWLLPRDWQLPTGH